jgi:sulfur-oxidizing protein SoxB
MRLNGQPIEAGKTYKVAGWAPVERSQQERRAAVWDVVETWLKANPVVKPVKLNNPELPGMAGNPGLA